MKQFFSFLAKRMPVEGHHFSYALFSTLIASGVVLALTSVSLMIFVMANVYWGDTRQPEIYQSDLPQVLQPALFKLSPKNSSLYVGEYFAATLLMDTGDYTVTSGRAVITYDVNSFEYVGAQYLFQSDESRIAKDTTKGAVLVDFKFNLELNGKYKLANIIFKTKKSGKASVGFDCSNSLLSGNDGSISACQITENATVTILNVANGAMKQGCSNEIPTAPTNLRVEQLSLARSVRLSWDLPQNATYVSVYYGTESELYDYGVPNIGITDHYEIHDLEPATEYYFAVTATNGCVTSTYSDEVRFTTPENDSGQVISGGVITADDGDENGKGDTEQFLGFGRSILIDLLNKSPLNRGEFIAVFSILIILVSVIVFLLSLYSPTQKPLHREKVVW